MDKYSMNIYTLIKETRYNPVHSSNQKHLGHTVVSTTHLPPQHMPKLNTWIDDNSTNYRHQQVRYTLHKTVFEP